MLTTIQRFGYRYYNVGGICAQRLQSNECQQFIHFGTVLLRALVNHNRVATFSVLILHPVQPMRLREIRHQRGNTVKAGIVVLVAKHEIGVVNAVN